MITSSRIGRYGNLCNSMFQFAALLGMAKKGSYKYTVPYHETYFDINYGCNNTSIFDGFYLDVPIFGAGKIEQTVEFPFHYEDIMVENHTDMVGYFQSEKYFESAEEEIKRQFTIKTEFTDVVDQKIAEGVYPDPTTCTSLHIRLGDYTKKRNFHPAQPAEYWQQAVKKAGLDKIVIFSDEVDKAKAIFGENERMVYSQDENPFTALYHMSLCRNHIICNSTFGWWGAKFGEWKSSTDKVIVAPKLWFGPSHSALDPKDIIPDRWLKL